jgi:hypothetical protein
VLKEIVRTAINERHGDDGDCSAIPQRSLREADVGGRGYKEQFLTVGLERDYRSQEAFIGIKNVEDRECPR